MPLLHGENRGVVGRGKWWLGTVRAGRIRTRGPRGKVRTGKGRGDPKGEELGVWSLMLRSPGFFWEGV